MGQNCSGSNRRNRKPRHSTLLATAAFFATVAQCLVAQATDDKSSDIRSYSATEMIVPLEMIKDRIQNNFERIKTWTATYDFTDTFYFPGSIPKPIALGETIDVSAILDESNGYWEVTSGQLTFQWDVASDKLHVHYKPDKPLEYIDATTREKVIRDYAGDKNAGDIYRWIMTPEHWIEFGTNVGLGQIKDFPKVESVPSTGGRIAYRKLRRQAERYTRVVQPVDFFANGSQLFHEQLTLYANALAGKKSAQEKQHLLENVQLDQRTNGNASEFVLNVKYPARDRSKDNITTVQTTFDSSVGFNPISWIRSEGKEITNKRTFSYKKIDGIFIPSRVTQTSYGPTASASRQPTVSRDYRLRSATLNKPIPPGQFAIEQLGLKYGERMLDEIENQLYVVDKTGLVPVEKFTIDSALAPPPVYLGEAVKPADSRNWTLIVVNILILAGLSAIIWWRKRTATA